MDEVKLKVTQEKSCRPRGGVDYSFFNLGARLDGWSTPRPGWFILGKDSIKVKVKEKFNLEQATKAQKWSICVALLFL
jgi:hypothetical protein